MTWLDSWMKFFEENKNAITEESRHRREDVIEILEEAIADAENSKQVGLVGRKVVVLDIRVARLILRALRETN